MRSCPCPALIGRDPLGTDQNSTFPLPFHEYPCLLSSGDIEAHHRVQMHMPPSTQATANQFLAPRIYIVVSLQNLPPASTPGRPITRCKSQVPSARSSMTTTQNIQSPATRPPVDSRQSHASRPHMYGTRAWPNSALSPPAIQSSFHPQILRASSPRPHLHLSVPTSTCVPHRQRLPSILVVMPLLHT